MVAPCRRGDGGEGMLGSWSCTRRIYPTELWNVGKKHLEERERDEGGLHSEQMAENVFGREKPQSGLVKVSLRRCPCRSVINN